MAEQPSCGKLVHGPFFDYYETEPDFAIPEFKLAYGLICEIENIVNAEFAAWAGSPAKITVDHLACALQTLWKIKLALLSKEAPKTIVCMIITYMKALPEGFDAHILQKTIRRPLPQCAAREIPKHATLSLSRKQVMDDVLAPKIQEFRTILAKVVPAVW